MIYNNLVSKYVSTIPLCAMIPSGLSIIKRNARCAALALISVVLKYSVLFYFDSLRPSDAYMRR